MGITNSGTNVNMSAEKLPTGYTLPTVTEITDYTSIYRLELSVLKVTVDNATDATTLTNIIGDATIGIDKQVDDILAADLLASATHTHYQVLTNINSNIQANNTTDFYNDTVVSYVCTVTVYLKSA